MMNKALAGVVGTVYGIDVAITFEPDGSIIVCKELVEEFIKDPEVPERWRKAFDRKRFGK